MLEWDEERPETQERAETEKQEAQEKAEGKAVSFGSLSDQNFWLKKAAEYEAKGLEVSARQAREKAKATEIYDSTKK